MITARGRTQRAGEGKAIVAPREIRMKSSNLLLYAATLALLAGASTRTAATGPRFSGEVFTWGKDQVTGVVASDAVAIGGGVYHNIILKRDGTVGSWGWKTKAPLTPPPTAPPGLS